MSLKNFINKYPILFQCVGTGTLMGTGDILAQGIVEKRNLKTYDPMRTLRFFGIGFALVGPAVARWYKFMNDFIGSKGTDVAIKKAIIDQVVFAPTFLPIFIFTLNFLEGKTIQDSTEEVKKNFVDVMLSNYKVWPFVQFTNFYFMPIQYQLIYVQTVALFWNTYLSWKLSN